MATPLSFTQKLRILWLAFVDERTPLGAKVLIVLGIFYGVFPFDFIPDFLPVVGELDDLTVLIVVFLFFLRMTKPVRKELERQQ